MLRTVGNNNVEPTINNSSGRSLSRATSTENLVMRRVDRSKRKLNTKTNTLQLAQVLGLTLTSNKNLSQHPQQDLVVYPIGCGVVVYDWKRHLQLKFLMAKGESRDITELSLNSQQSSIPNKEVGNGIPKPIVSTAFSPCGKFVAVGESGHLPKILIFDWESEKYTQELLGHKFGVQNLVFSPDQKYLVSMGYQHDGVVNLWNYKTGARLASNRITSKVNSIAFSSDGSYFVTVGLRHVRYWYLRGQSTTNSNTQVLEGRSAVLGDLRSSNFVDVVAVGDMMYTLTSTGTLCQLDSNRKLLRFVDLKVKAASSLTAHLEVIVIGCSDGVVRLFTTKNHSIKYLTTLPKPHPLGVDVAKHVGNQVTIDHHLDETTFPDLIATKLNFNGTRVISVYSDRSLYVWDIVDLNKVGKVRSCLYHSDSIWTSNFRGNQKFQFATGSSDGTVRFWDLDPNRSTAKNIFSKELLKILYVEKDAVLRYHHPPIEPSDTVDVEPTNAKTTKPNENLVTAELTTGIRALKFTDDGKYLVTGDRSGNLRVHATDDYQLVTYQEAHDGEILDLDVLTLPNDDRDSAPTYAIASASRDRLIHLFALTNTTFKLTQTLDEHSSSVTAVNFFSDGTKVVSGSADKSCIFRSCLTKSHLTSLPHFNPYFNHCGRATVFDMDLDPLSSSLVTVTNDKKINLFDLTTGKLISSVKPSDVDPTSSITTSFSRISLDRSGQFAALAATDKSIRIIDLHANMILSIDYGHSEMVTSIRFSCDCNYLISTGGDGLVFVYRILPQLAQHMRNKLAKLLRPLDMYSESTKAEVTSGLPTSFDQLKSTSPRPRASSFDISSSANTSPQLNHKRILPTPLNKSNSLGTPAKTPIQPTTSELEFGSPTTNTFGLQLGSESPTTIPLDELEESIILDHTNQQLDHITTTQVIETNQFNPNPTSNTHSDPDEEVEPSPVVTNPPEIVEEEEEDAGNGDQKLESYLTSPVPFSNHRRSLSSKFMAFSTIKLVAKLKAKVNRNNDLLGLEEENLNNEKNTLTIPNQFNSKSNRIANDNHIKLLGHRLRKSRSQQELQLNSPTETTTKLTEDLLVKFENLYQELEQVKDAITNIKLQYEKLQPELASENQIKFTKLLNEISPDPTHLLLEKYSEKLLNLIQHKLQN